MFLLKELLLDENDLNDDGEGGSRPYLPLGLGFASLTSSPMTLGRGLPLFLVEGLLHDWCR